MVDTPTDGYPVSVVGVSSEYPPPVGVYPVGVSSASGTGADSARTSPDPEPRTSASRPSQSGLPLLPAHGQLPVFPREGRGVSGKRDPTLPKRGCIYCVVFFEIGGMALYVSCIPLHIECRGPRPSALLAPKRMCRKCILTRD